MVKENKEQVCSSFREEKYQELSSELFMLPDLKITNKYNISQERNGNSKIIIMYLGYRYTRSQIAGHSN